MVDHHVDRPEVEAGQPAQPTGTNRSIGFERRIQRQGSYPAEPSVPPRRQAQRQLRPEPENSDQKSDIRSGGTDRFRRGDRRCASNAESQGGKPLQKTPHTTRFVRHRDRKTHRGLPISDLRCLPSGREGLHGLVAIARGKTPDPIPNSAVKTLSADGTAP